MTVSYWKITAALALVAMTTYGAASSARGAHRSPAAGRWSIVKSPNQNASGNSLASVANVGHGTMWAVGQWERNSGWTQPLIERERNGSSWQTVRSPWVTSKQPPGPKGDPNGAWLNAVSGSSPSDVWAVGARGAIWSATAPLILHFNGSRWKVVAAPYIRLFLSDAAELSGVVAISSTDV